MVKSGGCGRRDLVTEQETSCRQCAPDRVLCHRGVWGIPVQSTELPRGVDGEYGAGRHHSCPARENMLVRWWELEQVTGVGQGTRGWGIALQGGGRRDAGPSGERTVVALAVSRMGGAYTTGHDEGVVSATQVTVVSPTQAVTLDKVRGLCAVPLHTHAWHCVAYGAAYPAPGEFKRGLMRVAGAGKASAELDAVSTVSWDVNAAVMYGDSPYGWSFGGGGGVVLVRSACNQLDISEEICALLGPVDKCEDGYARGGTEVMAASQVRDVCTHGTAAGSYLDSGEGRGEDRAAGGVSDEGSTKVVGCDGAVSKCVKCGSKCGVMGVGNVE
ncbi:hypothetical protein JB92DRAFT_2835604 [Gautieria morchelliformis]|nr:hypothetical protein JB92DRAFT_2835604 [Gautieria morchelliformis]